MSVSMVVTATLMRGGTIDGAIHSAVHPIRTIITSGRITCTV